MFELLRAIRQRPCPKCGVTDSMDIQLTYYCIVCRACHAYYLDPFRDGPWDAQTVLDTVGGDVVYSYVVDQERDAPELELDVARAEFFRYMHKDRQMMVAGGSPEEEEGE